MANTKIDSIKLAGSTKTFDIDLPSTATPSIAGLTTSGLTVNGSITISGDNPLIHSDTVINITGSSSISINAAGKTTIEAGKQIELYSPRRIHITASDTATGTISTVLGLKATNINIMPYNYAQFSLPPSISTTTTRNTITLETSEFIDSSSPCIALANNTDLTSVSGKIGITYPNGIGLIKTYDGSAGNNTYLTVNDSCVNMGLVDVVDVSSTNYFATFSEKSFNITLSQNLLFDGADPFMRITGTLSNFNLDFPSAQTDITIDEHNIILNGITPKITTSQGKLIAYPGCGYTSTASYTIPSRSDLKSQFAGSNRIKGKPDSTLALCTDIDLSGDTNGAVYHIWGFESGDTGQIPGEIRVTTTGAYSSDEYTIIVAGNDNGYHGNSYISLTVIVPAGETYYLWAKHMGEMKYSKVNL